MERLGVMGCLYFSNDDWGVGSNPWLRVTWTWNMLVILFWMSLLYPLLLFTHGGVPSRSIVFIKENCILSIYNLL
ncbi:hypothetical protein BDV34DRAFT_7050 [Aspergillus parasiticus]|uniref:Uncharacterized protein n=1 Tax=Aspergillus parasiticus TaxID=5067 RepID=A0A5N6DYT0_ASPPA|nr:hypothetical protein BDV34DRAFT_7050 [Aspergillus parasiticus]